LALSGKDDDLDIDGWRVYLGFRDDAAAGGGSGAGRSLKKTLQADLVKIEAVRILPTSSCHGHGSFGFAQTAASRP
jgi:hypothetical protein